MISLDIVEEATYIESKAKLVASGCGARKYKGRREAAREAAMAIGNIYSAVGWDVKVASTDSWLLWHVASALNSLPDSQIGSLASEIMHNSENLEALRETRHLGPVILPNDIQMTNGHVSVHALSEISDALVNVLNEI